MATWRNKHGHVGGPQSVAPLHCYADASPKHRLFVWLECPHLSRPCQLIAIACDDDTAFGILHSRFHEAWSLRLGTSLEDRPRYTLTTTFETFPFPEGLSPDIPASEYANDPRAIAIAEAARRLVALRDRWINPPEWVEWIDEPVPGYPKRPAPRDEAAAQRTQETYPDQPLQHPPAMARRRPRGPRRCRRRGLWVGRGYFRR